MASPTAGKAWLGLFALILLVHQCKGFSRGAPDTACNNMIPRHSQGPRTTPPPYSVTPLQTQVEPGGKVVVRIASTAPSTNFRGFMLHAVGTRDNSGPYGTFVDPPDQAKPLTCQPGLANSLTHANAQHKSSLDLTWQAPPNFEGDVTFACTFVQNYDTFWVAVPAATPVRVTRSAHSNPTTYGRDTSEVIYPSSPAYNPSQPPPVTTSTVPTTTKIVTDPWSFTTPASGGMSAPLLPSIYHGCRDTKGCFGLPDQSCIQKGTCTALLTYALKGTRHEFELWSANATANSYVAVGFSFDNRMGDDSVDECTLTNGRINVYTSYNDGKRNVRIGEGSENGLSGIQSSYTDGNLYCRFTRETNMTVQGRNFQLDSGKLYLLLARGPASPDGNTIQYHAGTKASTAKSVQLADTGAVAANRNILVKLHGAFMVAAWLFSASMGILFARYFRLTWVGKQLLGKDIWFGFHRGLMMFSWALSLTAVVLIFIELRGWTSVPIETNPHALIGMIVTVLAFIQPIMAYFRPHPGTPKRFIFNWAHWLVGNSAHILAIVCIFLAVDLEKAAIPYWVNWILVTYVAIHAFSHLILSLAQCCYHADGSRKSSVMAMRDLAPHQSNHGNNQFYSTQQADKKEDAHGSVFRKIVLAFYCLLVASFSAAVIGVIVTGPWSK